MKVGTRAVVITGPGVMEAVSFHLLRNNSQRHT